MATYLISDKGAFVCLLCGHASYNPNDLRNKYCGHCKIFHEEEPLVCDFCMRALPLVAVIKAERKLRGQLPGGNVYVDDDLDWGACAECHALIQAENWPMLVLRGIQFTIKRNSAVHLGKIEELRQKLVFIYAGVFGEKFKMD